MSEVPHTSEPVMPDKFARPTGSTALAMEVNALTARLTALEAALKAERAEVDAWRARERTMPYLPADTAEQHRCDAWLIEARAATDAARKECGL